MNDHIRQLAGQALDRAVPQTWTTLTAYDLNKFTEVFAELIVQECLEILNVKEYSYQNGDLAEKIKQHFGVKS